MVAKVVRLSKFLTVIIVAGILANACGKNNGGTTVHSGTPTDQTTFSQFVYNDKPAPGKSFHYEQSATETYISLGTDQADKNKVLGAQIVLLLRKDKSINAFYLAYVRHQYASGTFCRIGGSGPTAGQENKQLYFSRELGGTWGQNASSLVLTTSTGTPAKTLLLASGAKGLDSTTPAINLTFDPGLKNSDLAPLASQKHLVDYVEDPAKDINYWEASTKNPPSLAVGEAQLNKDCSVNGVTEAGVGTMPMVGPGAPPAAPTVSPSPGASPVPGTSPAAALSPSPSPSVSPTPSHPTYSAGLPMPPTHATPLPAPKFVIKHTPAAVKSKLRIPAQHLPAPLPPTTSAGSDE